MKKAIPLLLTLALTMSFTACGTSSAFSSVEETYTIDLPLYQLVEYRVFGNSYQYSDFVFDDNGLLTEKACRENNHATSTITYTYDEQGRVLTETETSHYGYDRSTYTYNGDGHIATLTESSDFSIRDGNVFQYVYEMDEQGRVVQMTVVNVTAEDAYTIYSYVYDDQGNVAQETQTSARSTYVLDCSYDNLGHRILERVKKKSDGSSHIDTYSYACVGSRTLSSETDPTLAAPSSWVAFQALSALPTPDSCVTTISQDPNGGEGVYRLPGDKDAAYLEYLKYLTILSDLCGFTTQANEDGSTSLLLEEAVAAVLSVGYDAEGFFLQVSFSDAA